jgi:catechol 2,3-dioxygenase-like lactoylglutathione lyase family enzyme
MAIEGLNHFNIIAPAALMAEVRDFYVDVIGLQEGYRPDFGFPGHWLYAGESAVLHLMDGDAIGSVSGAAGGSGTGHLDHIAFTATELDATEARLTDLGLEFRKSEFPDFHLAQLFLRDPVGLGVEMNFTVE